MIRAMRRWQLPNLGLWDIPEIPAFYQKTFKDGFPWIYWLQPDFLWVGYQLLFACGCDVSTTKVGDQVHVQSTGEDALTEWMEFNFGSLNLFTDANDIPIEINEECSENLTRCIKTNLLRDAGSG